MNQANSTDGLSNQPANVSSPRFGTVQPVSQPWKTNVPMVRTMNGSFRQAFDTSPEQGCELLFRRYHRAMCSHAARYVYSKEVAEDIVSDVFCKFWKTNAYASVTSSFRFYLFRSVRNEAYSYLRSEFTQLDSLDNNLTESDLGLRPDYITQYEETFNRVKELVAEFAPPVPEGFSDEPI